MLGLFQESNRGVTAADPPRTGRGQVCCVGRVPFVNWRNSDPPVRRRADTRRPAFRGRCRTRRLKTNGAPAIGYGAGAVSVSNIPVQVRGGLEPTQLARFEALVLPHLNAAYSLAHYLLRDDEDARETPRTMPSCVRCVISAVSRGRRPAWLPPSSAIPAYVVPAAASRRQSDRVRRGAASRRRKRRNTRRPPCFGRRTGRP